MDKNSAMRIANEKGIALVLSLFLMVVMSVLGASLMFLSQTETYSSMNYRLMSQARYGAESGIQRAGNYLVYTYAPPVNDPGDPLGNYNTGVSPVTCSIATGCPTNGPVVLSGNTTAKASNYPIAAKQAAFLAAVQGTMLAGNTTVSYAPYATLMSMQQIAVYGGGIQTIQTWQLTAIGSITEGKTAQAEVSAILETPKFPAVTYSTFATATTCGALQFGGNTQSNSYSSAAALVAGKPATVNSGGNVGTNGNMTESGSADIFGTLSSPRVGIGDCSDGNVDALSSSGGATINGNKPPLPGDVIQLPQAITLPTPAVPAGVPTTAYAGGSPILNGASVGNVTFNGGTLTLGAVGVTSTINMNSLTMTGNSTLTILGTVILNLVGGGGVTPVFDTKGCSISNQSATFDPSTFQILYAGIQPIELKGDSKAIALIYAPNAAITVHGNNDFYGSLVGATVATTGSSEIHYDRNLSSKFFMIGNPMMSAFNWKKY
jgi:Tfp pilus assembly protein PilX